MKRIAPWGLLAAALLTVCLPACQLRRAPPMRQVSDGEPGLGPQAIEKYGCGGCHVIPGVAGAKGRIAAPLNAFAERAFVAGILSNTPENLIRWIQYPRDISPQTAMPNLGVTEAEARDIAAYLYSIGD